MKANRVPGILKAIAFITIVFLVSCCSDEPVVLQLKPIVDVQRVESVTTTTATVVASVVANEDNAIVSVMYRVSGGTIWVTYISSEKVYGDKSMTVNLPLKDLLPGTQYDYKVAAKNIAGVVETTLSQFSTEGLIKAIAVIKPAIDVKIDTATVYALVTPNQDPTIITFEYRTLQENNWQSKTLAGSYKGSDSIKVSLVLTGLIANTDYVYRVKVSNKAGDVVSISASFTTCAVKDYDGNYYHTVVIGRAKLVSDGGTNYHYEVTGSDTWLKENFKGTHYANGDPIQNVTDPVAWGKLNSGAYCYYENNPKNGEVYGGLYNSYVGLDPRGLIVGWKVPTIYDFVALCNYLGGYYIAGPAMMEVGSSSWKNPLRPGTNISGFEAIPNGAIYSSSDGNFKTFSFGALNSNAYWWTVDISGMMSSGASIAEENCWLDICSLYDARDGFGLRLIKK